MSTATATVGAPAMSAPEEAYLQDVRGNRIKLLWILRLHWGAIVGQTIAIVATRWIMGINIPVPHLFGIVAIEVVANAAAEVLLERSTRVSDGAIASVMVFRAVVLTALLALSGGVVNPFSTMYLVDIALATVLLGATWAWTIFFVSLSFYGAMFGLDQFGWLQFFPPVDRDAIMARHMQGMWVAFAVAAAFIVYIVQRVQVALTQVQEALAEERSLSLRKDKVASLATLAAGAAHELSTPLSTIAVAVKELQRSAEKSGAPEEQIEDLDLIREQVKRCRNILHHMSVQAGQNIGEPIAPLPLSRWVQVALEFLPDPSRVELHTNVELDDYAVKGPARGLTRALRSLLKNAVQASPPDRSVQLRVTVEKGQVRAEVEDGGCGMPPDILSRAGEPFFTTKVPGEGMGLGLFLTYTLAEQLGGGLEISSTPGVGTTATIKLPASSNRRSDQT